MLSRKRVLVAFALTALLSLGYPTSAFAVDFGSPKSYPVGTSPVAVAVGDFNGDGKPDIAVANSGNPGIGDDGNVSILLGNGDGTFQLANNIAAGKNPISIVLGDFNRDGRLDVVVANNGINTAGGWLAGTVSVLLGNGDGTFQTHVDYATGTGPNCLAVGDFNGDQKLDLAVMAHPSDVVSVLLGNGDGTFQAHVDYATGGLAVAVADFNQDGKADLAVSAGILDGNGDGTFQPPVGYDTGGGFARSIAVGDFNGDGKLDLVVRFTNLANGTASSVGLLLGKGDGTFSQGIALPTGACHAGTPFAADFDGDGKLDLAVIVGGVVHEGVCQFPLVSADVLVFGGNGDGTFQPPGSFTTANAWNLGAAADLDGDELPDLVVLNSDIFNPNPRTISVLLNSTAPDFSLHPAATSLTVKRGEQMSDLLTFGAQGGFSGTIALACSVSGLPPMPTCGISPQTLNSGGTATLTINAAVLTAEIAPSLPFERATDLYATMLPLGMLGCVLATGFDRKRRRLWALFLLMLAATILPTACGGGSSTVTKGPPPQNYTVMVTGTSGAIQHSTTISVTVQ